MAEQLIDGRGNAYALVINSDGSLNVAISGGIFIGSVSATVDSIYIQSGNNIHLGSAWENIGSVIVSNPVFNGSSRITYLPNWDQVGSVYLTNAEINVDVGSETWIKGGSILTYSGTNYVDVANLYTGSNAYVIGSVSIINSGSVIQSTNPWIVTGSIQTYTPLGSTFVTGSIYTTGSLRVANLYEGSEVWLKAGSIQTYTPLGIGSMYTIITTPTLVSNNPYYKFEYAYSGTATSLTGSAIGSITMFIGAGSFVRRLTYNGDFIITMGSYS